MSARTAGETMIYGSVYFPLYMNMAIKTTDPLKRFQLFTISQICSLYHGDGGRTYFQKPLNPILGETISGFYQDGTLCYGEQVSHHPPIPYFLVIGPNNSYRYFGYGNYKAKAGFNSGRLINSGKRQVVFKDGQVITVTATIDIYEGTFWG